LEEVLALEVETVFKVEVALVLDEDFDEETAFWAT